MRGNGVTTAPPPRMVQISSHCRDIKPISLGEEGEDSPSALAASGITGDSAELKELKESLRDTQPVGTIVSQVRRGGCVTRVVVALGRTRCHRWCDFAYPSAHAATAYLHCPPPPRTSTAHLPAPPPPFAALQVRTVDQAKAVLTFVEAAAEKTLRATVALTAGRGRGKSAALGLSLAAAIAYGYANIFVTSPTPENLRTLFEFVLKGFDALGYKVPPPWAHQARQPCSP